MLYDQQGDHGTFILLCVFADGETLGWFRSRCCCASGHSSSGGQQPLKMMENSASDSETEDHGQPLLRRKDSGDIQKGRKILTMHAVYVFVGLKRVPLYHKFHNRTFKLILYIM